MGAQVITEGATFFFSSCLFLCACHKINLWFLSHIGHDLFHCGHWWCMTFAGLLTTPTSTDCSPFALLPQAKRRLALDDSDHQSESIRTPRGKAATANGTRIKAPRSEQLRSSPYNLQLCYVADWLETQHVTSFVFIPNCVFFFLEVFNFRFVEQYIWILGAFVDSSV